MRPEAWRRARAVLRYSPAFERAGRQGFRAAFCVAWCVFLVNTALCDQQLRGREDQAEPATGWRKADEKKVSVPAGTMLAVRLIDPVPSDKSQAGDRFHGSLDAPSWLVGPSRRIRAAAWSAVLSGLAKADG